MRLQVVVGADTAEAQRGLQDLQRQALSFGDTIKQGIGIAAGMTIITGALSAIGSAFGAAKGSAIDFNQQIDAARASMSKFFDSTQSLNNSLTNLQALANTSPFQFKDLVTAQQRTIAAAESANQLKANMDAITVAAANTGRVSGENFDRISLALGQITSKGRVQGDELMQLNEAGLNAAKILADYFHTSTGAVQQMVQEGKVSSADMWAAFRQYAADPKNREALDQLAVTFEGAMSTIKDVLQSATAQAFRPFFDLLTEGANAVAKFLQSDEFKTWAEAIRLGIEGAANGVRGFFAALAPLGQAIQAAFGQFTNGDFAQGFATLGAAFNTALGGIWTTVTGFIGNMFGAGANLATSFADGILQGGVAAVQGAIDAIAGLIASFLIGSSPPPAGPLSKIDEGGRNTAQAWVDPFAQTLTKGVGGAVDGAAATIRGLQAAGRDADDAIRGLEHTSKDLDKTMAGIRERIADIKSAVKDQTDALKDQIAAAREKYGDAISTIRDQIDTIRTTHEKAAQAVQDQIDGIKENYSKTIDGIKSTIDGIKDKFAAQQEAIQTNIDTIKERYTQAIDAVRSKIDGIKEKFAEQQAAIEAQITTIKDKYGKAIDDVKTKIDSIKTAQAGQLAPLEAQVTAIQNAGKYLKEQLDAEHAITNARTEQLMLQALGDPALRGQLQGQLAILNQQQQQLDLQQQLNEAQGKLSGGGLSPLEQQSLQLKVQQLQVQQKLADLVNSQQLGEATRQQVINDATQKQVGLQQQIADAQGKLLAIPIEEKIAAINAQATNALVPLEAQLKRLEGEQKTALDPLEAKLKSIKTEEADALRPLETRLKSLQQDQKAALEPLQANLKAIKREEADALRPLEANLKAVEAAQKAALGPLEENLKGIKREATDAVRPLEEQVNSLQKASDATIKPMEAQVRALEGAAKDVIKPLEAQLESLGKQKTAIGEQIQSWRDVKAAISEQIAEIRAGEAAAKEMAKTVGGISLPAGGLHFDLDAAQAEAEKKIKEGGAHLAQSMSDGFHDWVQANFLSVFAGAIGAVIGAQQGAALGAALGSVVPVVGTVIGGLVGGAIGAGIGAIAAGTLAAQLQKKIEEIVGAPLVQTLQVQFAALQRSVSEQGLSGLIAAVVSGLQAAVPTIAGILARWGTALVDWLVTAAPVLFNQLQTVINQVTKAIGDNARPLLDQFVKWELALVEWARTGGLELMSRLATLLGDVLAWIGANAIRITGQLVEWATAFVAWVGPKIPELLTELGRLVVSVVEWMAQHTADLLDALGKWAVQFVEWVAPKIPPLLAELGNLLVQMTGWMLGTALPAVIEKLAEWGAALVSWVGPRIVPLLAELAILQLRMTEWMITVALPAIVSKLVEWGGAFLGWVAKDVLPQLGNALGAILTNISTWITEHVAAVQADATRLGVGMIDGMKQGLTDSWASLRDWITEHIGKQLPEWMQNMLGIHSPSTVFADIGRNLIAGLIHGMESKTGDLIETVKGLTGRLAIGGAMSGDVDDWLKAAINITKVPDSWLDPLRWLVAHESTGNPGAVNPVDVGNGEHAAGLLQTIPSTFEAYRVSELPDDIFNPIANAAAAIRYIIDRYGSVFTVPGIGEEPWTGYATGGIVTQPTVAMIGERGPEGVFTADQMAYLGANLRGGNDGGVVININAPVYGVNHLEDVVLGALRSAQRRGRTVATVV